MRWVRVAAGCAALLLVPACGGSPGQETEKQELDAAEPAQAPEPTAEPAGTTRQVAPEPQGIAYDPVTDSIAVGARQPERLLVLDPRTLETRREVPLPGKVRHLQVRPDEGAVLVPSETADTFFEVGLPDAAPVRTEVENHPHDASAGVGGPVVVANEFAGSISVVRGGEVVHTFSDLTQPGGVVVQSGTAIVVDVEDFTVTTYDLDSLQRVDRAPGGEGPTHVARLGDGRVAVTDTRGDAVRLYQVDPLREVATLDLPGSPYGIAGDPESGLVWVTLTGSNQVVGLDASGGKLREVARYPTVRQPDTVTAAPGSQTLWVTGRDNGQVQRISR